MQTCTLYAIDDSQSCRETQQTKTYFTKKISNAEYWYITKHSGMKNDINDDSDNNKKSQQLQYRPCRCRYTSCKHHL